MNWEIDKNALVVDGMEIKVFPYPVRTTKEIQGEMLSVFCSKTEPFIPVHDIFKSSS